ncbi:MAG: hypothetical protein ACFCVK_17235 [Acidimicrobiales bacterium]
MAPPLEHTGRRWLLWSFVFCPCHLPLTMGVLATVFGGSAFGAVIAANQLWVGVVCGTLYAIGVGIGFRYLRRATAGLDCSSGSCELPAPTDRQLDALGDGTVGTAAGPPVGPAVGPSQGSDADVTEAVPAARR